MTAPTPAVAGRPTLGLEAAGAVLATALRRWAGDRCWPSAVMYPACCESHRALSLWADVVEAGRAEATSLGAVSAGEQTDDLKGAME